MPMLLGFGKEERVLNLAVAMAAEN